MQEKRISSKINYDVLNDLTVNASKSKSSSRKQDKTPDAVPAITPVGPIFENKTTLAARLRKASATSAFQSEVCMISQCSR